MFPPPEILQCSGFANFAKMASRWLSLVLTLCASTALGANFFASCIDYPWTEGMAFNLVCCSGYLFHCVLSQWVGDGTLSSDIDGQGWCQMPSAMFQPLSSL